MYDLIDSALRGLLLFLEIGNLSVIILGLSSAFAIIKCGTVNGIAHHILEKQVLEFQEGTLRCLEHANTDTAFDYDGSRVTFSEKLPRDLPVSKASMTVPAEIAETPEAKSETSNQYWLAE